MSNVRTTNASSSSPFCALRHSRIRRDKMCVRSCVEHLAAVLAWGGMLGCELMLRQLIDGLTALHAAVAGLVHHAAAAKRCETCLEAALLGTAPSLLLLWWWLLLVSHLRRN